ncbi:MAG: hypothetical protein AUJ49_00285 [Desulfovibrionaceae bacterium CG1_02_65_16]|nr:MAG: hypothetical protein AUJ49_00285 [Desulfovibrionaceae bacterium CG1_02_65_16]
MGEPPRHRVLEALSQRGATLHELEYEDLALTTRGLRLVRHAAMDVLRRFFSVEAADVPPARALALFLDRVFWDEQTGGLLLCADFPGQSFCLPLPRDLWGLRVRAGYSQ